MDNRKYSAGIYARLSVDSHNRKNDSIESQIAIAKAWIAKQEDVELEACYTDLGKTGTHFQRKGWERMWEDLQSRKINCVVVKDFSRFGRDYLETGMYMEKIFPAMEVRFVAVTDHFDSRYNGSGGLEVKLKNLVNEMYAKDISVKVKTSRGQARKKGDFSGGCAPYGYRIAREGKRRRLAVEEEGAKVVRQIFEGYGDGKSMRQIAEELYRGQIHRPADCRRYGHVRRQPGEELRGWTLCSVRYLLANPVYAGGMPREDDKGRAGEPQAQPRIVSRRQFDRAAYRLGQNGPHCARDLGSGKKEADLFAGFLYCGECMHKMQRYSAAGKTKSGETCVRYGYCCPNSRLVDERKCGRKAVSARILRKLAETALRQGCLLCGTDQEAGSAEAKREAQRRIRQLREKSRSRQNRLETVKSEGGYIYARYREGAYGLQDFENRKKKNALRVRQLTDELEGLQRESKQWEGWLAEKEKEWDALLGRGEDGWLNRGILEALVDKILVYPDRRVEVVLRFCPTGRGKGKADPQAGQTGQSRYAGTGEERT